MRNSMRNRITAALVLAMLLLLLCGCSENKSAAKGQTVTDMIGREVPIEPGSYEKIVCIGAGALRMYCYVGETEKLCGVEDIDNLSLEQRPKMFDGVARPYLLACGESFRELPSCGVGGPNAQSPEAEKLLSCDPDLVISEYEDVQLADALQKQLGVPVVTLKTGTDGVFDAAFSDSLLLLGTVLGREERAQTLSDFVLTQTAQIAERTADITDKPSVYVCGLGNWGTTDHLTTAEHFAAFEIANVRNAVCGLGIPAVGKIEKEKFIALGENMDIMVIDAAAVKNIAPLFAEDPTIFDSCRAWRSGEVYLQMAYNAYYTNFEIALMNAWFTAKAVYPDAFADVDMTEKTNEITAAFLGKPLAEQIFDCPTSFGGYQKIDTKSFFQSR